MGNILQELVTIGDNESIVMGLSWGKNIYQPVDFAGPSTVWSKWETHIGSKSSNRYWETKRHE